jgi:hypothetical protein
MRAANEFADPNLALLLLLPPPPGVEVPELGFFHARRLEKPFMVDMVAGGDTERDGDGDR